MLCFYLLGGSAYLIQARHWKPVNFRRQMAAAWGFAARVPLARPHPLPNIGALPVPFTIKIRSSWPLFLAPCCGLAGCLLLLQTNFLPGVSLVLGIIIGASIVTTIWAFCPQQIEITYEGIRVRNIFFDRRQADISGAFRQNTIRWNEARLFAVRDGKPGTPAIHYELSSPYQVVKWARIRRPHWWSLCRPAVPFAEYDAQMEALIALISGVTGLPLYDVR